MVQTVSIFDRLARRERESRVRPSADLVRARPARPAGADTYPTTFCGKTDKRGEEPQNGGKLVPAGVDSHEWGTWGEEARYVFEERMGVGAELGMAEAHALRLAVVEARMVHAGVPVASWSFVGLALRVFEGSRIVAVEPRSNP